MKIKLMFNRKSKKSINRFSVTLSVAPSRLALSPPRSSRLAPLRLASCKLALAKLVPLNEAP